jgi:hypothetical protein
VAKAAYTAEELHHGRSMVRVLVVVSLAIAGLEFMAYLLHSLQIWESFLVTPVIPALLTISGILDYELGWAEAPWRKRWVQSDFRKASLMVVGGAIAAVGLVFVLTGVSTDLTRATVDVASGASLMSSGIYIVKRFSW